MAGHLRKCKSLSFQSMWAALSIKNTNVPLGAENRADAGLRTKQEWRKGPCLSPKWNIWFQTGTEDEVTAAARMLSGRLARLQPTSLQRERLLLLSASSALFAGQSILPSSCSWECWVCGTSSSSSSWVGTEVRGDSVKKPHGEDAAAQGRSPAASPATRTPSCVFLESRPSRPPALTSNRTQGRSPAV